MPVSLQTACVVAPTRFETIVCTPPSGSPSSGADGLIITVVWMVLADADAGATAPDASANATTTAAPQREADISRNPLLNPLTPPPYPGPRGKCRSAAKSAQLI